MQIASLSTETHFVTRMQQLREELKDDNLSFLLDVRSLLQLTPDRGVPHNPELNTSPATLHDVWCANQDRLLYSCPANPKPFSYCQVHWMLTWTSVTRRFSFFREQPGTPLSPLPPSSSRQRDSRLHLRDAHLVGVFPCLHSSVDRLPYMDRLVKRWQGPFSIAIFTTDAQLDTVDAWLHRFAHLSNLRVTLYIVSAAYKTKDFVFWRTHNRVLHMRQKKQIYPINYLRDVAILNVVTTHYINLDMDLWPTSANRSQLSRRHRLSALEAAGPSGAQRSEVGDHPPRLPALRQHAHRREEDAELHDR